MHGVKRTRQSPEAIAARKEKERAKLAAYIQLNDEVFRHRKEKDTSPAALDLTTTLLAINPELQTIWNYRRHILSTSPSFFRELPSLRIYEMLMDELELTTKLLRAHPKVYAIWNHRRWCLERIPSGPVTEEEAEDKVQEGWRREAWGREMALVEKMLEVDARNFHAWDYRRYILASQPSSSRKPLAHELAYTTKKIEANFSNFSAWHQRTKVYSKMWAEGEGSREDVLDAEFEFIKQAMYTDPNDQSAWLYHRWLVGEGKDPVLLQREIASILELLELEPESKWCLEALTHYTVLLLRHSPPPNQITAHPPTSTLTPPFATPSERRTAVENCERWLAKLEEIDPYRRVRYREIRTEVVGLRKTE